MTSLSRSVCHKMEIGSDGHESAHIHAAFLGWRPMLGLYRPTAAGLKDMVYSYM